MSAINLEFNKQFNITLKALQINGSSPLLQINLFWCFRFIFVFTIKITSFIFLFRTIIFHNLRDGDFVEATKNTTMVAIFLNTSMKYFVLLYHKNSIVQLIHTMDEDYTLAEELKPQEQDVVKQYARKGRNVSIFWWLSASTGIMAFPAKALIQTIYSFRTKENLFIPMFEITYPNVIEKHKAVLWGYCCVEALCLTFAVLVGVMYIGFDPLIPIFTLHICGQLDILSARMKTALSIDESVEKRKENLKLIIIKLQKLYKFVNEVQDNFSIINEFNMKTTALLLPLTMVNVVQSIRSYNTVNIEFIILWGGSLVHFLMPCYFGDLLIDKSLEFREAVYSCRWENEPNLGIRKTILFMLTRTAKPLSISTIFNNMSLETFAQMMQQSYTLFNLMNTAWGK